MSSAAPFIGIVTVLYNSDDVLPDFFSSLAAQEDVHYRLYVIDNSATARSSENPAAEIRASDERTIFCFSADLC